MSLKSITCLFSGYAHEVDALHTAFDLASRNAAYLRIVHPKSPAQIYASMYGGDALLGGQFYEQMERDSQERLDQARQTSERLAGEHGVAFQSVPEGVLDGSGRAAMAVFVPLSYTVRTTLIRDISLCDLIVVGHQGGGVSITDESNFGTALFSSHRPVLAVTAGEDAQAKPEWSGRTAMIAWRDTPEATRALINALPLLKAAERVMLATVGDARKDISADVQMPALAYLKTHGIQADPLVVYPADGQSNADALIERTKDAGADFLVMGAYGHSVFRETLLGGFSSTMLEDCKLPLLLSH